MSQTTRRKRSPTARVSKLLRDVKKLIEQRGCVSTREVMDAFGVSHTQAYYVLKVLADENGYVKRVIGRSAVFCRGNSAQPVVHANDGRWVARLDKEIVLKALKKLVATARGHRYAVRLSAVVRELNLQPTANVNAAVKAFLEELLDGVVITLYRTRRNMRYIIDVAEFRRRFGQ